MKLKLNPTPKMRFHLTIALSLFILSACQIGHGPAGLSQAPSETVSDMTPQNSVTEEIESSKPEQTSSDTPQTEVSPVKDTEVQPDWPIAKYSLIYLESKLGWYFPEVQYQLKSLNPERPYTSEKSTQGFCGGIILTDLPAETEMELIAEYPNFEPVTYRFTSQAAEIEDATDKGGITVIEAETGNARDAETGDPVDFSEFEGPDVHNIQASIPKATLLKQTLKIQLNNAEENQKIQIQSLVPEIPLKTELTPENSQISLEVPTGVEIELSAWFSGATVESFPFAGTLERTFYILPTPLYQDIQVVNWDYTHYDGNASCDLSTFERETVHGVLSDAEGQAISGALIQIDYQSDYFVYKGRVRTGADGKYAFPGIRTGLDYTLKIEVAGQSKEFQTGILKSNKEGIPGHNRRDITL